MAENNISEARAAADAIRESFEQGVAGDVDLYDMLDAANRASNAPEAFGDDVAASAKYHDDVMTAYFDASFSRYLHGLQDASARDAAENENEYLASLASAAGLTSDGMNRMLAEADVGMTSGLRKAEAAFFYN